MNFHPCSQAIYIEDECLSISLLGVTCRLLITFANSLDPDQDQQNIGPDLDPNSLTLIVFMKDFFKKKSADDNKSVKNYIKSMNSIK